MPREAPVCSVEEAFARSIDSLWPEGSPRSVVVAVSGGADSVALLALCAGSVPSRFEKVVCAHFNHSLRGAESDEDERFVQLLAQEYGLDFRTGRWFQTERKDLSRPDRNLQAAARKARYRFLAQVAREEECDTILTAHHARDQVESVLQNLARGGGTGAWEGIRPILEMNGVPVARPLLALSPNPLRQYLKALGKTFREDSSNRSSNYKRNWIRKELLPKLEAERPSFEAEVIRRWDAYRVELEGWTRICEEIRKRGLARKNELMISRCDFASLPRQGRFLCLRELLRGFHSDGSKSGWSPTRKKPLEDLFALLDGGKEGEIYLPGNIQAKVANTTITFSSQNPAKELN